MTATMYFRMTLLVAAFVLALALATAATAKPMSTGQGGIGTGSGTSEGGEGKASSDGTFPIIGAHTYGDGIGAGRGHQGQDLLAKCGKPVVAAVGGRVQVVDYQASGAGNHVVITGKETKLDYVYMHLASEAQVSEGERVETGQTLGRVGTTGSSSTCHLHCEMWSAPGWYQGGDVLNPEPQLRRWDAAQR